MKIIFKVQETNFLEAQLRLQSAGAKYSCPLRPQGDQNTHDIIEVEILNHDSVDPIISLLKDLHVESWFEPWDVQR